MVIFKAIFDSIKYSIPGSLEWFFCRIVNEEITLWGGSCDV
ncbi:hypothetical protein DSUL_160083 [Desulfovibrionales bacterium]